MYRAHFGLDQPPFRITPDPAMFFSGARRGAVLDALTYAIQHGEGLVKVVGEVGSGKTMLCRTLAARLPSSVEVLYLANPSLSPENILHAIAMELGLPVTAQTDRLDVMAALQAALLERHAQGRRPVVFVEEAQGMPLRTLEELRLLSNLETHREKLLQIVLFGQPELEDILRRHEVRQLADRITHGFVLDPLAADEVAHYIEYRLRAAGYRGAPLFAPAAVRRIARSARGLVRRVNVLCDKALLAAFADGAQRVEDRHARAAVRDSGEATPTRWPRTAAAGIALALLASVAVVAVLRGLPAGEPAVSPPSPSAATIATPIPVDPVQDRLARGTAWLARVSDARYVVQLMLAPPGDHAADELLERAADLGLQDRIYVYAGELRGRPVLGVVLGDYASHADAAAALAGLPAEWLAHRPYVRTVRSVRRDQAALPAVRSESPT